MKNFLLVMAGLMMLYGTAMAESSGYGVSFGYGVGNHEIDIYRVGVKKDFLSHWFETRVGYLSGYYELSYNHWEYHNDGTNGLAFSPVFTYCFADESSVVKPYIEGGVGVAYFDEDQIGYRNLSTNFLFEDRIGLGTRIGFFDLNVRYMHYSNASIKGPNDGIDIWIFTTAIQF